MYEIYHNPHCSKSREALTLLRENAITPVVVEYMKDPIAKSQIIELLRKLSLDPRDLLRKSEREYKTLGLGDKSLSDDYLLNAMVGHPKLIERPIIVKGDKAVIGRPAKEILNLMK